MERAGIKIDRDYTIKAKLHAEAESFKLRALFKDLTGKDFVDSNKVFSDIFSQFGVTPALTAKGNPSFDSKSLEGIDNPIARAIEEIRGVDKLISTYYSNFLRLADRNDFLHADIKQAGTESGRFSYREPNLQNLAKNQKGPYYTRKCFVPSDDKAFVMIDYQQQEFRMMIDYAGESKLIKEILDGKDVHQATADLIGISRDQSKTINFGLLYGMGTDKLALSLKVTPKEAREIKLEYFSKLPKVEQFIKTVTRTGKARGFIYNWYGRRNHIADPNFAYILPNHLIQGGCADVIKIAMNKIDDFLMENCLHTQMKIQVHDELVLEMPPSEFGAIQEIQKIMESTYTSRNGMVLTTSVEHSFKSWASVDKIKGVPCLN
jgi:DNA polymerase-1